MGSCGNKVGLAFFESLCKEHDLGPEGDAGSAGAKGIVSTYFEEATEGRHVPRAVLADLDPAGLEGPLAASPYGKLFNPDNAVVGRSSAANNFAKGRHSDGAQLIEPLVETVRQEVERCDALQGFQLVHSLGGGTGSGFGSLCAAELRDEYPERVMMAFSVFPSSEVSDTVVEPYNAALAMHHLIEHADGCVVLDNEALHGVCSKTLGLAPAFGDLNGLIATAMTDVTCGLRFPSQLDADLRKQLVNLCPFQRTHFFSTSLAPLAKHGSAKYHPCSVADLSSQLWRPGNSLSQTQDAGEGHCLTASATFRGKVTTSDVEEALLKLQCRKADTFVDWIPSNVIASCCDVPHQAAGPAPEVTACLLANATGVSRVFSRILQQFDAMFARKGFTHWYTEEGMDPGEFEDAADDVEDLVEEYGLYDEYGDDELENDIVDGLDAGAASPPIAPETSAEAHALAPAVADP